MLDGTQSDPDSRQARAYETLVGLSVGDAFGQLFYHSEQLRDFSRTGTRPKHMPPAPWRWSDDTHMAAGIYENLRTYQALNSDALAMSFGINYLKDPERGYGASMQELLPRYARGANWQHEAPKLYGGQGSFGNGAAMRVSVIGAYFADDPNEAARASEESARITHTHPEALAGAIAVGAAAALAWRYRGRTAPDRAAFLDQVLDYVPIGEVRIGIARARDALPGLTIYTAAGMLGNGSEITSMDTVPFALFSAAEHLIDYKSALWATAELMGDVDTNCAIVGGVSVGFAGRDSVPPDWLDMREPLPNSVIPA